MFDNIYRILIYIGSLLMAIEKVHNLWISSADPIVSIAKIVGIIIIVWFLFTPNDLLQEKDRQ